jgi:hypothetical protein
MQFVGWLNVRLMSAARAFWRCSKPELNRSPKTPQHLGIPTSVDGKSATGLLNLSAAARISNRCIEEFPKRGL